MHTDSKFENIWNTFKKKRGPLDSFSQKKKSFYYKSYEIFGGKPVSTGSFSVEKEKAYSNLMYMYQSWNH